MRKSPQFAITIFLSAFLLFQVQPILGRFALPWFGGTPAVWTNCLLFFQFALLAGYLYAHFLGSVKSVRTQAMVHTVLLAASLLLLPIIPAAHWKPSGNDEPSVRILLMLAVTIGAPYFLLSSTAPLVQRWHTIQFHGTAPWRLYALSNVASFLALLSYPFLIEPYVGLERQAIVWSSAYGMFTALCVWTVWSVRGSAAEVPAEAPPDEDKSPSLWTLLFWLALAAAGSLVLMGTTNEVSQEIAVSPFLWIAPLSVYLLTFVLTFDSEGWYKRKTFSIAAGVLAPAAGVVTAIASRIPLWSQFAVYLVALFAVCMLCNGELVRAKPSPRHLTAFYLCVAGGGALGGVFAALVAPRIFSDFYEYPIGLAAACFLGFVGWLRTGVLREWTMGHIGLRITMMALLIGGVSAIMTTTGFTPPLATYRNFFGILRVAERRDSNGVQRRLTHGRILHGFQYLDGAIKDWPTTYYGPHSGIGAIFQRVKPEGGRKIGVVGLGTGTIAAWGRPGDTIRFYEINPDVVKIANGWFSYLKDSKAQIQVVLGDARIQMERELEAGHPQGFDVLAVDAFSSDAIPMHLLTAEAADIYRRHLAPDGILMLHISNRTVNLEPVARALAQHMGWEVKMFASALDQETGESPSKWVALTPTHLLREPDMVPLEMGWTMPVIPPILWTDDFASLWPILDMRD